MAAREAFVQVGLLVGRAADEVGYAVGNPCGFTFGTRRGHPLQGGGRAGDGRELAAGAVTGQSVVSGFQNGGRGAVAFGEAQHAKLRPAGTKSLFYAGIRAAEAVDGLIRVADAEESRAVGRSKGFHKSFLQRREILHFVHENVLPGLGGAVVSAFELMQPGFRKVGVVGKIAFLFPLPVALCRRLELFGHGKGFASEFHAVVKA